MMKFDHVVMNPPYDGNLHLKVVQEAMKHSDDVVNLSPIRWLQDPLAEYKKNSDFKKFENIRSRIETIDVVLLQEASKTFNNNIRSNLGIYHITKNGGYTVTENPFIKKMIDKFLTMGDSLAAHLTKRPTGKFYVKVCDGITTYNNGTITLSTFCIVSPFFETATIGENAGHTKYINVSSVDEQKHIQQCYTSKFMRWWNKNICSAEANHKWTPFFDFSHPWDDAALYKYFGLTQEEISLIEEEMKGA